MISCVNWLEAFLKQHPVITLAAVYEAGKKVGFTKSEIKKARRWYGRRIETQVCDGTTLWRWA